MKQHQKFLLAFAIILVFAAVLWGVKSLMSVSENSDQAQSNQPSTPQEDLPEKVPVASDQPDTVSNAADPSRRRFIDMSARESIAIMQQIKTTDPDTLFELFLDAGRIEQDPLKQSALQGKLSLAIKAQVPSPEFMEKMKEFVMDTANSHLERGLVVSAFASAHSYEGSEFVLWAATSRTDPEMKRSAARLIGNLGGAQPYLPPMIEPLWKKSNDTDMLNAVAKAMAREAAPSSIELLLPAASAPEGRDDARRSAAAWALKKVFRKDAVPVLAAALEDFPVGNNMNALALATLSQIGDESAAQTVINWFQDADSSASPLVAGWLAKANFKSHLKAAEAALDPSVPFRSEDNREAIREALAAQRAGSTIISSDRK